MVRIWRTLEKKELSNSHPLHPRYILKFMNYQLLMHNDELYWSSLHSRHYVLLDMQTVYHYQNYKNLGTHYHNYAQLNPLPLPDMVAASSS
jgi:hypothetical protein